MKRMKYTELTKSFDNLDKYLKTVDIEPEELQRGFVADQEWQSGLFQSVVWGVKIPDIYLSEQDEDYTIKDRSGNERLVSKKTIDGLQRLTTIKNIMAGKVRLPYGTFCGSKELSDMNYPEIQATYPDIASEVIDDCQLRFIIYSGLTPEQESFQFRIVLNNGNKMEAQQRRNPIVSEVAAHVRRTARQLIASECHILFEISEINGKEEANCFNKVPKKMEFDQEYARIIFWIRKGLAASSSNKNLDNMYEDPKLKTRLEDVSVLYNRNTNLGTEGIRILNKLYDIFGDGKSKQDVGILTFRSAVLFLFELQIWEKANKAKVKNISKLFWDLHDELNLLTEDDKKAGLKKTIYSQNLSKISTSNNVLENADKWKQLIAREA